ncbi:MAG: class I SAM-dependent methyltransferase [Polyangiales bacterium]
MASRRTAAADVFERAFLASSIEREVAHCDRYELTPRFRKWLPERQPILEAGCGSGRWVVWFARQGWQTVGVDWSEALCARAREAHPRLRFVAGDLGALPFDDGSFGAVVALGSVEHEVAGPEGALREFHRVLRPGGVAIVTVPYLGVVRRLTRLATAPLTRLKNSRLVRRLTRQPGWQGRSLADARADARPGWAASYTWSDEGCAFFEYTLSKSQMRRMLRDAGFEVLDEFVAFGDEGVLHSFGRAAGRFDEREARVAFSPVGRVLREALPVEVTGHMLGYVAARR